MLPDAAELPSLLPRGAAIRAAHAAMM